MSYFLIFLAVMLAAAVAAYVVGLKRPDESEIYQDGLMAPVKGLPPVLLPQEPEPADVDKLRFSLGLRGYRMDQVDEVLDRLRDELAAKDRRIAELVAAGPGALGSAATADDAGENGAADVSETASAENGAADVSETAVPAEPNENG